MLGRQKLQQIFNASAEQGLVSVVTAVKLLKSIGINQYQPAVLNIVRKINYEKPIGTEQETLDLKGFLQLVELLNNPFNKQIWEKIIEFKQASKQLQAALAKRDMMSRDRQMEAKFILKVGPDQKFQNAIKVWLSVQKNKKIITPWVNIHFVVQRQEKKEQISNLLKETFNNILEMIKNENPGYEKNLNETTLQTRETSTGVQAIIQMRNEKVNQLQAEIASFLKQVLQTEPSGKLEFNLKSNKDLLHLFNRSSVDHFMSVAQKDYQLSLTWTVNRIMTAIKQLILESETFMELQYDKVYPPGIIGLLLSNAENIDCEIQFDNVEPAITQELANSRNQALKFFDNIDGLSEILNEFGILKLLNLIGNQIKIEGSFSTANFGVSLNIKDLAQVLKTMLGIGDGQGGSDSGSDD